MKPPGTNWRFLFCSIPEIRFRDHVDIFPLVRDSPPGIHPKSTDPDRLCATEAAAPSGSAPGIARMLSFSRMNCARFRSIPPRPPAIAGRALLRSCRLIYFPRFTPFRRFACRLSCSTCAAARANCAIALRSDMEMLFFITESRESGVVSRATTPTPPVNARRIPRKSADAANQKKCFGAALLPL